MQLLHADYCQYCVFCHLLQGLQVAFSRLDRPELDTFSGRRLGATYLAGKLLNYSLCVGVYQHTTNQ